MKKNLTLKEDILSENMLGNSAKSAVINLRMLVVWFLVLLICAAVWLVGMVTDAKNLT
ncbi:MAG: hypothetical protein ACO20I_07790 [bacterium]